MMVDKGVISTMRKEVCQRTRRLVVVADERSVVENVLKRRKHMT